MRWHYDTGVDRKRFVHIEVWVNTFAPSPYNIYNNMRAPAQMVGKHIGQKGGGKKFENAFGTLCVYVCVFRIKTATLISLLCDIA